MRLERWRQRRRDPAIRRRFLGVGLLAFALLAIFPTVAARWRVGIGLQQALCLPPWRVFLIDRANRTVRHGDFVAFHADDRLAPWFPPGILVVKAVRGVPGDRIVVRSDAVLINNGIPRAENAVRTQCSRVYAGWRS